MDADTFIRLAEKGEDEAEAEAATVQESKRGRVKYVIGRPDESGHQKNYGFNIGTARAGLGGEGSKMTVKGKGGAPKKWTYHKGYSYTNKSGKRVTIKAHKEKYHKR